MFLKHLFFTLIFCGTFGCFLSTARAEEEDVLASPYFIDGLHCSGLSEHGSWESVLVASEEAETLQTIEAQEDCIELMRVFGLEKYSWISPEELERASAQVSQSTYFEVAQLSIKKSALMNHVHVFLKVKTKAKYVYNFSSQTRFYSWAASPRAFQRLSGELLDRSLQPNATDRWGFHLDLAMADQDRSDSSIYNKNFYFADFYYQHQRMVGQSFTWSIAGRLNADNSLNGKSFDGSVSLDSDFIYSKYFRFIRGSLFGGFSAIFTPDFGYFASLYLNQNTSAYDTPIFLPGFKVGYLLGQGTGTFFRTEIAGYRALYGQKTLFEWKSTLQFDFGQGVLIQAGFNGKQSRDLILPRDRSPSTDALSNQASLAFIKAFGQASYRQELELKAGFEKVSYSVGLAGNFSPFTQVGYRLLSDQLNLNFSFAYLPQRIF